MGKQEGGGKEQERRKERGEEQIRFANPFIHETVITEGIIIIIWFGLSPGLISSLVWSLPWLNL